jgi:tetratricopeptide (TPR) repeat protein
VLDQRTGVLAKRKEVGEIQEKHNYSPGNLVIGDGYLVLAQPSKLVVFCQYEVLISRYRELIAQNPSDPEPHLRLARAAEANDAIELAVEHYRATIELTSADGSEEERAMRQTARMQLYSMLQQLAEKTAATSDWSRADGHWREAAIIAPTLQSKLNVMLQRAAMWVQANDGSRAVAIYQDILADDTLRGLGIALEGNRTVRVDVEVADRIDGVLDRFGRTVYARYESAAVDLLSDAQRNDSLASSERLLRTHPNSEAAVQALLYLADRYAEKNQITSATALYKQVLNRTHRSENDTIAAMHGLAQLEESRRHWQAARKWWQRLAQEFPNSLAPNRPEQSVASYVQERLQGAVYEKSTASVEDRLELPLTRRWNRVFDENHRIVIPRGTAPTELGTVLLIGNPQSVECVSTHQSASLWTVGISGPIRWAAFNEDQLLVGTDTELARIATATGEATWRYRSSSDGATFGEFHLIDGRVFLREDAQRVACIDANSGNVLWTYAPTDASIQPRGFFSVNHLALRTKDPS